MDAHSDHRIKTTTLTRGSQWAQRLWILLVEPLRPTHVEPTQSHLLSLLLLVMIPGMITAAFWAFNGDAALALQLFLIGNTIVLFGAYCFNRFGYYGVGAGIVVLFLSAMPFVALMVDYDYSSIKVMVVMVCIVPGIIAAYLLFSLRGTALSVLIGMIATILLPLTIPEITYGLLVFPLYFATIVSVLMLIAAVMRVRYTTLIRDTERALSESEARYRDLFEATFEPIAIHDQGVIVDANPALAKMLQTSLPDLIGRRVIEFIHPDDQVNVLAQANSGATQPYEARVVTSGGQKIWVEIRGKSHMYKGKLLRVAGVRDISLSKRAESHQIEMAIEREKVNVLQRFIGNMSHDLRTPLTVIKTSVYLFKRLKNEPEKQLQQVDSLSAQVDHLNRLFDDLLSMSKLDKADTSDYRFKWLNINLPTQSAVQDHLALALRRRQKLEFVPDDRLPDILIDRKEYRRMVNHLILNGLGHTPEGGSVTVQTSYQDHEVVVSVRDTGAGIGTLELPLIFERYYYKDNLQNSTDGGTGLGLNIARKIAEAHGGRITVESQLGTGSVFRVHLPVLKAEEASAFGISFNQEEDVV